MFVWMTLVSDGVRFGGRPLRQNATETRTATRLCGFFVFMPLDDAPILSESNHPQQNCNYRPNEEPFLETMVHIDGSPCC